MTDNHTHSEPSTSHDHGAHQAMHDHNVHLHMMQMHAEASHSGPPAKPAPAWVLHLVVTLITGGLWIPVWVYFAFFHKKKT